MKTYLFGVCLAAGIACLACHELENPLTPIPPSGVVLLEVVNSDLKADTALNTMKADSISSRLIRVTVGEEADAAQPIIFSTTYGVLTRAGERVTDTARSTLTITPANREALLQVHALDIPAEEVIVSGTLKSITSVVALRFVPAFPSSIIVTPSTTSLASSDVVRVDVQAHAENGYISENLFLDVMVDAPDSILVDYPQRVPIVNQKATFLVKNILGTTGKIRISVKAPVSSDSMCMCTGSVSVHYH